MPMEESEEGRVAAAAELAALEADLVPKLQRRVELRRRLRMYEPIRTGPTYAERLVDILSGLKRPASPSELLDLLLAAGGMGAATRKDQMTSVVVTLQRHRAFRKVQRGLYGLASWDDRAA